MKNFTLIQWNINGFRSHFEELKVLLHEQKPEILCIQESKLRHGCPATLKGYDVFRYDNPAGDQSCGGVAILADASLGANEVPLNSHLQAVCVTMRAPIHLNICSVYLPPPPVIFSREDLLDLINQVPHPQLIVGDFNAHHLSWGSNHSSPRGDMIVKVLDDLSLVVLNDGSTTYMCPRNGTRSAIDLSLCSPSVASRFGWLVLPDQYGSDHAPIKLSIRDAGVMSSHRPRWLLERADWEKFRRSLIIPNNDTALNLDSAIDNFTTAVTEAANDSIPRTSGSPKRKNVPWWNEDCKKALRDRRKCLRKFERQPTAINLEAYRRSRAKARLVFRKAMRLSWQNYVTTISRTTPSSEVWRKLRSVCGKPHNPSIPGLRVGDILVTEPKDVADTLAFSIAEVSKTSSYSYEFQRYKQQRETHHIIIHQNQQSPLNVSFSLDELDSALLFSTNSAPGPDDIPYAMLRELPSEGKSALLALYNRVFEERKFPLSWRKSFVVALYKQGQDRFLPSSYRPISLTNCICKILERMVNRRLVWYLENNRLLSTQQCGFREGRSTLDLLSSLESAVLDAFIQRKQVLAVFFDIKKAYDTAWRRGILDTLSSWGVGGNMLSFIQGFMTDRMFQVKLGKTLSEPAVLENGVPQGSVLSCTLFAVSINSITSCVLPPVESLLFVDDFAIYVMAKRLSNAERCMQLTINRLTAWSKKTGFEFSATKTSCICFSKLRNIPDPNLTLAGVRIPVSQRVKFLGLTFDPKLSWIPHLKELKAKCTKRLNLLKVLSGTKWGADRTSMLQFYRAYIRPCLDYGSQVYSSARPSALRMLDAVHHSGIRLATGAFRSSPVGSLLAESGEPPLSIRRSHLLAGYHFNLKSKPDNPAHHLVLHNRSTESYGLRPKAPAPLGIRAKDILAKNDLEDIPAVIYHQTDVPPWLIPSPQILLTLHKHTKQHTSDSSYKQAFCEMLSALAPCDVVYTDGSKTDNAASCAFVTCGREYKFPLPPFTSVFTAELTAVERALNIVCPATKRLVLCTDSLSSLQAIENMYSKNVLVRDILLSLHNMSEREIDVVFVWVPGHVGICGNELADKAAREALGMAPSTNNVSPSDMKAVVRRKLLSAWNTSWACSRGNKLRAIKDSVKPWESAYRTNRREEVVVCRLRIGHSLLTHGFLMNGTDPPMCAVCGVEQTVLHILLLCPQYSRQRRLCTIPGTLQDVLGDNEAAINNLCQFLRETKLLQKL